MNSAPRARIAGLGLIGGSIGIALRRRGWYVAYVDPNVNEDEARRAGAADARGPSPPLRGSKSRVRGGGEADLAIVATPVEVAIRTLGEISASLVTSVCSVMQPLREAADSRKIQFVAGHPMAGSAERGLHAASGDLFCGKRWFVDRDQPLIRRMIMDCGAEIEVVDAAEHDAAVALTSHLPQILSTALAAYLGDLRPATGDPLAFAGAGLATFLRLAESDASVWLPVIEANRANIAPHVAGIVKIVEAILAGDQAAFRRAQEVLKRLQR